MSARGLGRSGRLARQLSSTMAGSYARAVALTRCGAPRWRGRRARELEAYLQGCIAASREQPPGKLPRALLEFLFTPSDASSSISGPAAEPEPDEPVPEEKYRRSPGRSSLQERQERFRRARQLSFERKTSTSNETPVPAQW